METTRDQPQTSPACFAVTSSARCTFRNCNSSMCPGDSAKKHIKIIFKEVGVAKTKWLKHVESMCSFICNDDINDNNKHHFGNCVNHVDTIFVKSMQWSSQSQSSTLIWASHGESKPPRAERCAAASARQIVWETDAIHNYHLRRLLPNCPL